MSENPNQLKEAFSKVKQDIFLLQSQISDIKRAVLQLKESIEVLKQDKELDKQTNNPSNSPAIRQTFPTKNEENQSNYFNPTHSSTDNLPLKALKNPNSPISSGNRGVPTNSQTVKQTDNSTGNKGVEFALIPEKPSKEQKIDNLEKIAQVINSLDDIKKDLRHKFKRLTNQELAVFSAIYQLEEQGFDVDYPLIAKKLEISESSIRDYIQRLIKKQIPIEKSKENNKKVTLKISQNLKKIASLATILQLREL